MIGAADLGLGYAAGALVAFSPCVLPALPLIASGAASEHRLGPVAVAAGLVAGFTAVGVGFAAFGSALGVGQEELRVFGAAMLGAAGLVMLVKPLEEFATRALAPVAALAVSGSGPSAGSGLAGQFALGGGLGLVWAPCSGPALGAALALAAQAGGIGPASLIMLLFGLGAATPLLVAAYGSRELFKAIRVRASRSSDVGKRVFGAALVAVAALTLSGLDAALSAYATERLPEWWLVAVTSL